VQGRGRVDLTDGFIWDIPIFGILTPALDGIAPGLGSSRARAASGTFIVTNGVLRTEDFEIRAPVMRLQYNGDVDLTGRVNARVQAELLRDIPAVGPMVSLVLWPVSRVYEYRITGTVQKPESEPIFFIPRILALPFHPLRTIREILPTVPQESRPEELSNQ
ncbi:MAG TPA: AsmA-like C-terminal region-containing protein, partial [Verrucomicrobiota bacterium]|nr:AsmA-like C-terminal region-containing protein [Verrucomicrobiota bacterium]